MGNNFLGMMPRENDAGNNRKHVDHSLKNSKHILGNSHRKTKCNGAMYLHPVLVYASASHVKDKCFYKL